eukprot:311583-Chlamydomonas_euryale.AAC.5
MHVCCMRVCTRARVHVLCVSACARPRPHPSYAFCTEALAPASAVGAAKASEAAGGAPTSISPTFSGSSSVAAAAAERFSTSRRRAAATADRRCVALAARRTGEPTPAVRIRCSARAHPKERTSEGGRSGCASRVHRTAVKRSSGACRGPAYTTRRMRARTSRPHTLGARLAQRLGLSKTDAGATTKLR